VQERIACWETVLSDGSSPKPLSADDYYEFHRSSFINEAGRKAPGRAYWLSSIRRDPARKELYARAFPAPVPAPASGRFTSLREVTEFLDSQQNSGALLLFTGDCPFVAELTVELGEANRRAVNEANPVLVAGLRRLLREDQGGKYDRYVENADTSTYNAQALPSGAPERTSHRFEQAELVDKELPSTVPGAAATAGAEAAAGL
jgi:hypothetical protein